MGANRKFTPEDIRSKVIPGSRAGGGGVYTPPGVASPRPVGAPPGIGGTPAVYTPGTDGLQRYGRPFATLPPFWLEKPPSGTDFYFNNTGALAAGAGSELLFPGVVQLPSTHKGVVRFLTIFVDAPTALLDVVWTLLVNGAPYPGWSDFRSFPRLANNLDIVFPGTAHLPQGSRVQVRATNQSAAGPWTIGAEIGGWFWPKIEEDQAFGFAISNG